MKENDTQDSIVPLSPTEKEQMRANKLAAIGVLAGGIAHDFNNILMAIIGNISLAKLKLKEKDEAFLLLSEAEKACFRAKSLTQQLLTFSKGGAPVKQTASLTEMLKDSVEFVLHGSNVRCDLTIADDLWPVDVDEGQINEVIHNLVINARQAMPNGGVIEIHTKNKLLDQGKRFIEIILRDQGVGIPKENLQKIFDPYFTTKPKGNGLGLATTYAIIRNHGGTITVDSEVGHGTTFTIDLPASDKKSPEKIPIPETPRKGLGKVLVMDDEEPIQKFLKLLLNRLGYAADCACDGKEAVRMYQQAKETGYPFDAVIMDLTIPGEMGGREAVEELKKIDPKVKAIVSSGYSSDPIMADFKQYGFIGVLSKPYRIEDLNQLLRHILIASPGSI